MFEFLDKAHLSNINRDISDYSYSIYNISMHVQNVNINYQPCKLAS